jgi:hypothetical protein
MKIFTLCLLLLISTFLHAEYDSIAIKGKIIATGDRSAKLRDVAGDPDSVSDIRNNLGNKIGETWDYKISGKYVSFDIYDGEIAKIND